MRLKGVASGMESLWTSEKLLLKGGNHTLLKN